MQDIFLLYIITRYLSTFTTYFFLTSAQNHSNIYAVSFIPSLIDNSHENCRFLHLSKTWFPNRTFFYLS